MTSIAEPAVSGPVVIKVGKKTVNLPVSAYTPAVTIRSCSSATTAASARRRHRPDSTARGEMNTRK